MTGRSSTERILDAYLAPEADRLPDRVIDAVLADIARSPQRRALRVPWRFPYMSNLSSTARTVLVGAVLLVAAGGATYLVAGGRPPATPTDAPPTSEVPTAASTLPLGFAGLKTYTSEVHGFTLGYPSDWSVQAPATRIWREGDELTGEPWPYADTFVSPGDGDDSIGLFVWEMPAGDGADVESVEGLKAWADTFCNDVGASPCEGFTQRAVPMCRTLGGGDCVGAILVPTAGAQYAFFVNWGTAILTDLPDRVRVVVVGREDSFPPAARYGGSVELLRSILTTMDVWTPGEVPPGT